jgi:hypothetical protein
VLVALGVVLAGTALGLLLLGVIRDSAASARVDSEVACRDLPTRAEVETVLDEQAELVRRLEAAGDVAVGVVSTCGPPLEDRGEVVVQVATTAELLEVRRILEEERLRAPTSIVSV